ncbi:LLM class flavin-dependent oxidoreductase [Herbiconiux sp. KACC 21604]|uniref:LLM class flavin-dependent oxidoreductase n=2 Tax=unclassified Herbiconiux TaxID=2618217 RepID=UPI00352E2A99|nr:LLM class flavin-dependent oxidoreductase [Herbiconiux sp. KACC 21604]
MTAPLRVGVMLPRDLHHTRVLEFARRAEELGFDELWVVEDLGFRGGMAQAAAVLAVTTRIRVGIGILPAAARNVAFEAMEIATLAQLFPGRLDVGIGHGMPAWMRSVGAWPTRPLRYLSDHTTALRSLLRGTRVGSPPPPTGEAPDAAAGRPANAPAAVVGSAATTGLDAAAVHQANPGTGASPARPGGTASPGQRPGPVAGLQGVGLEPSSVPEVVPPVLLGVRGPKSLALSGRVADGTVLAEPTTPEYARAALEAISASGPHALVAYNVAAVADDTAAALELARPGLEYVGDSGWAPHIAPLDFAADFAALRARFSDDDRAGFAAALPDEWVARLALAGTPAEVRARHTELAEAGVTSSVLIPVGTDTFAALESLSLILP